jgi:hypothetical protein
MRATAMAIGISAVQQPKPGTTNGIRHWLSRKINPRYTGQGQGLMSFTKPLREFRMACGGSFMRHRLKDLPQLNLEFAVLWDREACVFLAENR